MKKKKGFTLIELLVVISIIAMLLAILMPALGKVKKLAQRLVCGTNLKGMANALNVYAFDYRDEYPVAGGGGKNTWTLKTDEWNNVGHNWSGPDNVSVAASLFMLVREADVGVKSFICKGSDQIPFVNKTQDDMVELWDFGEPGHATLGDFGPAKCQSYSYQLPYNMDLGSGYNYPADGTSPPGNAIMADKNPWFDPKLKERSKGDLSADNYIESVALIEWEEGAQKWQYQAGNAEPHEREGQNVLFGDGHVEFTKRPDVATRYDNIYTPWAGPGPWDDDGRRIGEEKNDITVTLAKSGEDSMLVNDDMRKTP